MTNCTCSCHKAYKECDNCCKVASSSIDTHIKEIVDKPRFYQFNPVFHIRVLADNEEAALNTAKRRFKSKCNMPDEVIDDAFENGSVSF